MGYKLYELKSDEEFPPLFIPFRTAFKDPGSKLWEIFVGDAPCNQITSDEALKEATERFLSWHKPDPTSTWVGVKDEESGDIVAGGRWAILESEHPYATHEDIPAYWFREGEPRIVATQLLNQFLASAGEQMNRPHVFLNIIFTDPKHRRKGAASLVLDWGIEKARERGIDLFLEATDQGKPVYEKYGFKVISHHHLKVDEAALPPAEDPELRKQVIEELLPFEWWSMIRTADHK